MFRSALLPAFLVALTLVTGSVVTAGPFIPTKPEDLLPSKPEDLIPQFPGNHSGFSGPTKIRFNYTIRNNSRTTVRFRLPSGRTYTLKNGERGNYKFIGYKSQATIHVFNTGRTYRLTGGDHKFWWMSGASRVGFDLQD